MKVKAAFVALSLFCAAAWAGPIEEVAAFGAPRAKAFSAGDVEGWTAAYAENGAWFSQFSPYRIDGRAAIRAYFVDFFNRYPGSRNFLLHQPAFRAYGENLVVGDGYYQLTVTDKAGKTATTHARYTVTWAKFEGRWQIVSQHNAPVPPSN